MAELTKLLTDSMDHWLEQNIDQFDLTKTLATSTYKSGIVKSFIELLYMDNMFYPSNIFGELTRKIEKIVKKTNAHYILQDILIDNREYIAALLILVEYCQNHHLPIQTTKIQQLIKSGQFLLGRRVPYRLLEIKYQLKKAGFQENVSILNTAEQVVISNIDENWNSNGEDAYAITHSIFYLTDMGRKNIWQSSLGRRARLVLGAIATNNLFQNNLDIAGESFLSLIFLANFKTYMPWTVVRMFLDHAYKNQLSNGAFAGPDSPEGANLSDFEKCYHTTLVMKGAVYGIQQTYAKRYH
ncbi:DUF6895 family protein [Oenococcus sicerae]|uniref:DUF6895 family protein n=1 Tax=Oenococcus sicerae TaxID=2203724 RepID=UPI0039E98C27